MSSLRQIDSPRDLILPVLVRAETALFAVELGIDATRALDVDWTRFSAHNHFMALAAQARAMGIYVTVTGSDVPVSQLAAAIGQPKQIVSKYLAQVERARSTGATQDMISRVERILGVNS